MPEGGSIGITAAASMPESVVVAITRALRGRYRVEVEEVAAAEERTVFKPVPIN